jgi:hypothetical protein
LMSRFSPPVTHMVLFPLQTSTGSRDGIYRAPMVQNWMMSPNTTTTKSLMHSFQTTPWLSHHCSQTVEGTKPGVPHTHANKESPAMVPMPSYSPLQHNNHCHHTVEEGWCSPYTNIT